MSLYMGMDPGIQLSAIAMMDTSTHIESAAPSLVGGFQLFVIEPLGKKTGREAAIAMCGLVRSHMSRSQYGPVVVVAIEGQDFISSRTRNYTDIGHLALVSGAAIGACWPKKVLCPIPREWKGNVPKHIHHGRIAKKLGWDIKIRGKRKADDRGGYGVPLDPKIRSLTPRPSDWEHAFDAIGLAIWAEEQS